MATNLILDICGGEVSDIVVDGSYEVKKKTIDFDLKRINQILGIEIDYEKVKQILIDLNYYLITQKFLSKIF